MKIKDVSQPLNSFPMRGDLQILFCVGFYKPRETLQLLPLCHEPSLLHQHKGGVVPPCRFLFHWAPTSTFLSSAFTGPIQGIYFLGFLKVFRAQKQITILTKSLSHKKILLNWDKESNCSWKGQFQPGEQEWGKAVLVKCLWKFRPKLLIELFDILSERLDFLSLTSLMWWGNHAGSTVEMKF